MELKSVYIDRTGDWVRSENDTGKFYLKSEADKVIARHKYKRCLAMADYAMYHHFRMLYIYGKSLDDDKAVFKINYGLRWRSRWLALAGQFTDKEAE